jgi:hypothetical protein
MAFKVTAELVLAKDQSGQIHHRYRGDSIAWLSPEQKAHFLAENLVEEGSSADSDGPPAKTAPKAEWVAFAVSKGADGDEAEGLTKQELQDLYGD